MEERWKRSASAGDSGVAEQFGQEILMQDWMESRGGETAELIGWIFFKKNQTDRHTDTRGGTKTMSMITRGATKDWHRSAGRLHGEVPAWEATRPLPSPDVRRQNNVYSQLQPLTGSICPVEATDPRWRINK